MSELVEGWSRALAAPGFRVVMEEPPPGPWTALMAEVGVGPGAPLEGGQAVPVSSTGLPSDRRAARDLVGERARAALAAVGGLRDLSRPEDFVLDPDERYLNHGSFGATPRVVLGAQRAWQDELERQPMRFMEALAPRLREQAARVAARLGARPADLVFVDNASTAVTAVLRSLSLGPGDAILTTNHTYAAVRKTLDFVSQRTGCAVVVAQVPWPLDDLQQLVDAVERAWRPDVRVAVLDGISSVSATRFPLECLVPWLQARGARVLVDAAHMPGHLPLDLDAIGADWTAANLHKWWFTPKGCGVLHARADAQEALAPLVISHGWGQGFADAFELQGTRDPSAWLSVGAALDYVDALGGDDALRVHNRRLAHEGAAVVARALGSRWLTPAEAAGALVPVHLPGVTPTRDATEALVRHVRERYRLQTWIMPLEGVVGVRVCAQIYNRADDYERLAAALAAALGR